ncbi:MAG: CPBP family intramembrane metalloprotease [Vicingaceae bacterium]|nr:CPBP family intramembrane metalloprotease [Vicingaceae bacterium]
MLWSIWNSIFVDTFKKVELEKDQSTHFNKNIFLIFITCALSLVFIQYFGDLSFIKSLDVNWLNNLLNEVQKALPNNRLFELIYWVSIIFVSYFILPAIFIKTVLKQSLIDYGLSFKGVFKSYKIYLIFFLFMFPLVIGVSYSDSFQNKYPFYNPNNESLYPNFFVWQCFYFVQFFALEFFFRGFMVHGLKKKFGYYSIFIMMIPYCMIHFQKPMPETIGAIIAGVVLGSLSLKSKSIWLGIAIHYSVAITMDIAALWQKGYFS